MRTALVRNTIGNLITIREDFYNSNKEMATELRNNGFKVLKVWNYEATDKEVEEWEFLNRK